MAGILNVDQIANSAGTGPVTFPYGIIGNSGANIAANDSNVVFTSSSNPIQICTPTAVRTYTMPSSVLSTGVPWTFYNTDTTGSNYIILQSSGSNAIVTVPPNGYVTIIPTSLTPTSNTNWLIYARQSNWVTWTPTLTGFGTATTVNGVYRVTDNGLLMRLIFVAGTVAGSVASATIPLGFTISTALTAPNNVTSGTGNMCGTWGTNTTNGFATGVMVMNTGTSTSIIYYGSNSSATLMLVPANGNVICANTSSMGFCAEVPII